MIKDITNGIHIVTKGNSTNRPVLFIHGYLFDSNMWKCQQEFLSGDFYTISYDIRGFGKSNPLHSVITMEDWVDDLFSIIIQLNLKKPVICGLSLGGYIAQRAVLKNPELFSGAVFCNTHPFADSNEHRLRRSGIIKNIREEGLKSFLDNFFPTCFADSFIGCSKYKELYKTALSHSPEIAVAGQLAMLSRLDTTEVTTLSLPKHIIVGENDKRTPPAKMESLLGANTTMDIIPDAGHLSPIENPEAVNNSISNFLRRIT